MPIYQRALGGQQQLEGQATGMLGLATPPMTPGRPPLPSTDVGNVDFESAINAQRDIAAQRSNMAQQEAITGLSTLLNTGISGYAFPDRYVADQSRGILQGPPGGYQDIYGAGGGIPLGPGPLGGQGIPLAPGPLTRFG